MRLRLTQGEIRALAERGEVEERTEFPGGAALIYRLGAGGDDGQIVASFEGTRIDIRIPRPLLARWCGSELVTLSAVQTLPGGELQLVLEKDFACLTPRAGEDESDAFPHPGGGGARC